MRFLLAVSAAVLLTTTVAHAAEGVLEINQTCAESTTGCFPGDSAGLPVTINSSAGRSYRLTGDLVVPNENTTGIQINASSVTVDLNGFEIIGAGCVGATTVACRPTAGSGFGVKVDNSITRFGISVRNGSITGMGSYGVFLGSQSEVTRLRVRWNRRLGIDASEGSRISENVVYENGSDGIRTTDGSIVAGNIAISNGNDGINTGSDAIISGNSSNQNGGNGIYAGGRSTVSGNSASGNTGDGIYAWVFCHVQSNNVAQNTGFGLRLSSSAAYRENVINSNIAGTVTNAGVGFVNMGDNACNGTTTCP